MPAESQSDLASSSDVLIVGAGIVGLSLALELRERGASVVVLERGPALGEASSAAAGMLAAEDPHNPSTLLPFSQYSLSLYPEFLSRIETLSGIPVPLQTSSTVQHSPTGNYRIAESSLDPRQLGAALLSAARASSVRIVEHAAIISNDIISAKVEVVTTAGTRFSAAQFVHASGAWRLPGLEASLFPRKGQMLRVAMRPEAPLREVHRAEDIYVVPRASGPQAGTALIGATIEDAGFDHSTSPDLLTQLRKTAAQLAPATAFITEAPLVEAWAGLRPATPDLLPLLGQIGKREWIATGHFRNGILLAPGTAAIMAGLLGGKPQQIDIACFAPQRFKPSR